MQARKAFLILFSVSIAMTNVTPALADSCVKKYEARQQEQKINSAKGASAAVSAAVVVIAATVLTGGVGTIPTIITLTAVAGASGAPALYYIHIKHGENDEITKELSVLSLYQASKQYISTRSSHPNNVPEELRAFMSPIKKEEIKASVPDLIVSLMEGGTLCTGTKPMNMEELIDLVSNKTSVSEINKPVMD